MDRAGGNVAAQSYSHLIQNGAPIGVVAKADDRHHYGLFEDAKCISHTYIVGYGEPLSRVCTLHRV